MDTISIPTTYEGPPPPKGWRIKCVRAPKDGEYRLTVNGDVSQAAYDFSEGNVYPILERIEPVKVQKWANLYADHSCDGYLYATKDLALLVGNEACIATAVPVEIVYTPDK